MPTFTPPVADGIARGGSDSLDPRDRLMSYYGATPTGVTVWQDQNLVWHEQQYPYAGRPDSPGLLQARRVYQGGHVHEIDDTQYVELVGAGYQSRLNIADTEMTWRSNQISKLTRSQMSFTGDGAVPATPTVDGDQRGVFTLSAGPIDSSAGERDFWLHRDVRYKDFEIESSLDNLQYGVGGRLQQIGLVVRYQEAGGVKSGVTVNTNVFFFVPFINVGVWKANLDGTGFINRQYNFPVDSVFTPNFPFKIGVRLVDNICQVRTWQDGTGPPAWATDLTSQVRSKAINLDVNAGSPAEVVSIPTPVGDGSAGFIAAHLGTSALSKVGRTTFHNLANQGQG